MSRMLPLLREFGSLDKKRSHQGVTPAEFQRWSELRQVLEKHIPQGKPPEGRERRQHVRVPTRMLMQFKTRDQLGEAIVTSISRGGVFINTAFPPPIGSKFTLCLRVDATRESVDVPCEVVSHNVGNQFSTQHLGMGVKFGNLDAERREVVEALLEAALGGDLGTKSD